MFVVVLCEVLLKAVLRNDPDSGRRRAAFALCERACYCKFLALCKIDVPVSDVVINAYISFDVDIVGTIVYIDAAAFF